MKLTLHNSANGLIGVLIVAFGSVGISGGPVYPLGTNVVGTYAGTMVPGCAACNGQAPCQGQQQVKCKKLDAFLNENKDFVACGDCPAGCSANSQGIFSINVPDSGLSSGTFVMFSQGRVFSGTIQGTADAGRQMMSAILHATFDFTVIDLTNPSNQTMLTAEANGTLNAKISNRSSRGIRLAGSSILDITAGTVNGDLTADVNCHMALSVAGFKQ